MKLEVRNYIFKNKENNEKGKSISNFSKVKTNDFYNYLQEVINAFENKPYKIKTLNIKNNEKSDILTSQTILYNQEVISDFHFNNIKNKDTLSYVIGEQKHSEDMLIIPNDDEISLLTEKMDVNLNWNLLHHFPYLNEVVLDFINYKYECELQNKEIDYGYLISNIIINYQELIKINQGKRKEQKENEIREDKIFVGEINRIISCIETSALDESKKRLLIYEVKKIRK